MKIIWIPLTLLFPVLYGGEQIEMESGTASYNGKTVCLSGSVHLEHELGMVDAEEVFLRPAEKHKKIPFSHLTMVNQVSFSVKGGGQFKCARAELDRESFVGKFYSAEGLPVTYIEMVKGKRNTFSPLVVKSRAMEMNVAAIKGKHFVDRILALEDVFVDYNSNFTISSDRALYQRVPLIEGESAFVKSLPGSITLERELGKKCLATNTQGDAIEAVKIIIDTNRREIVFDGAEGKICTVVEKKPILFWSDLLSWDLARKLLKLTGNVVVEQSPMGSCKSNKEVHIYYCEVRGKKELQAIESFGKTSLHFHGGQKQQDHHLTCSGSVFVDHQKMETTLAALRDASGKVVPGTHVHFRGQGCELKAEKCHVKYLLVDGKMVASKITAEGDVSLLGTKACKAPKACKTGGAQAKWYYALADKVEFCPEQEEIHCSTLSPKKKRVLFYDKSNQLQISAPALKIKRESKKELIQGIGDVRLSFLESEFSEIKKHFNLEK